MTGLKALDVIRRTTDLDRPNVLNGYENELNVIENGLKALEIIKKAFDFSLEFDESQNEWALFISKEEHYVLVTKGTGIKTYNLLKEVIK